MGDVEDFIQHVGVKGMHWGQRKGVTRREQAVRNARLNAQSRRRQLSDKDLRAFVERLSTEKKFKDLVNEDLKPGQTAAKRILGEAGHKVAKVLLAGAALYTVKALLEKKFDPKEAAKYLTPVPKK